MLLGRRRAWCNVRCEPRPDARRPDARRPDARRPDARRPDARRPDARRPDARRADARRADARRPDARRPDARRADARRADARRADARRADARRADARRADARRADARRRWARLCSYNYSSRALCRHVAFNSILNIQAIGKSPEQTAKLAHANIIDIINAVLFVAFAIVSLKVAHDGRMTERLNAEKAASQARALRAQSGTLKGSVKRLKDTVETQGRTSKRNERLFFIAGLLLGIPIDYFGRPVLGEGLSIAISHRKSWGNIISLLHPTMLDRLLGILYLLALTAAIVSATMGRRRTRQALKQARDLEAQLGTEGYWMEDIIDALEEQERSSKEAAGSTFSQVWYWPSP